MTCEACQCFTKGQNFKSSSGPTVRREAAAKNVHPLMIRQLWSDLTLIQRTFLSFFSNLWFSCLMTNVAIFLLLICEDKGQDRSAIASWNFWSPAGYVNALSTKHLNQIV